jgi:hypothetical protein
MGGQACVLYGAAEFSRDADFAILADSRNLSRLKTALSDLLATPIAVPPFKLEYLRKGLALHFRCKHPEAENMRVDVMSRMRGVDPFPKLWRRRTTVELPDGLQPPEYRVQNVFRVFLVLEDSPLRPVHQWSVLAIDPLEFLGFEGCDWILAPSSLTSTPRL